MDLVLTCAEFTCCCEFLCVSDNRPAEEVLLSWRSVVRWMSEEAGDCEMTLIVPESDGEPAVELRGLLTGPVDMDTLCAVSTQLTLQLLCFHNVHISPQVQLGS